jgi:hypothetical protein
MSLTSFFYPEQPKTELLPQKTGNDNVQKNACLITDDEDLINFCIKQKYCKKYPANSNCKDLQNLNKERVGGKNSE